MNTFHKYYNLKLARSKDKYSEINVTQYSKKYNGKRSIKSTNARAESIIKHLKEMMEKLSMSELEVKLKE